MRTALDLIIDVIAALKDEDGKPVVALLVATPEEVERNNGQRHKIGNHVLVPELWEELQEWSMLTTNAQGANEIGRERFRQIKEEGYGLNDDDDYKSNQLIEAATSYLLACGGENLSESEKIWPWDLNYFKPKDTHSNLVRAGALIAAEIDRLHHQRIQEFVQRKIDADPDFFNQPGYPRNK